MPAHAEVMNAYELLSFDRAKSLLDDPDHIYSIDDAHFWLKWAMAQGGVDCDWTFSLAVAGLSIFRAQESYEDARAKFQSFIETGKFEQEEEQDPDIIINQVYEWVCNQYEERAINFSWNGEVGTHYVTFSFSRGSNVVRAPSDPLEEAVPVFRL